MEVIRPIGQNDFSSYSKITWLKNWGFLAVSADTILTHTDNHFFIKLLYTVKSSIFKVSNIRGSMKKYL